MSGLHPLPAHALPRTDKPPRQQTPLPTPALPRMDRSHRQQTPLSPRPPSPAWTGLIASRLLSPYARPPPHGQVSPPADSSLLTLALPRMGQASPPADSPLTTLALPRMDRSHRQQTPSPHARPPPHGQVSSPGLPQIRPVTFCSHTKFSLSYLGEVPKAEGVG